MTHSLKCRFAYIDAIAFGAKRFEIRKADRNYAVGDTLVLREVDEATGEIAAAGMIVTATVQYILTAADFPEGIKPGYIVMSIKPRRVNWNGFVAEFEE